MQSIMGEIARIEWRNHRGISSQGGNIIALLVALNEIADQLAIINKHLASINNGVRNLGVK
jgi:hypothetical protein